MALTSDSILALASDSGSGASARSLATPARWPELNLPGGVVWGRCQGSGKTPYLTAVDLDGLVSKCSCPSRKFPCKHALALLLLSVSYADSFGTEPAPESIQTWLHGRQERAGQKGVPSATATKDADPAAQARRRAARERKVTAGLAGLDIFLQDLVRDGLAQARVRPYTDWDTQAARLVDAQAPGAARQVRRVPELLDDPAALLTHLSLLHLLCEAWTRREALDSNQQADLRAALGFPLNQADLSVSAAACWEVLGQITLRDEDNLTTRRTWLRRGERSALLLDFAVAGRPLPPGLPVGQSVQAEVCFVPSAAPQRAVIRGEVRGVEPVTVGVGITLEILLDTHAQALALNPWRERTAHLVGPVRLLPGWQVGDEHGQALPLMGDERLLLGMLARSAGGPVTIFGEWDGAGFTPLSLLEPTGLTPLRGREEQA
ncbi:SWIM zinc finger family protein [Deinococcus deserti]|uniref:Putative SWIM zinc finger domain protein n=1 Tax=Deinococcus deserti (strain DSM 17065 / CIP 109153 / LMG 22923 / VCD115) TaxID=546414 RepID=C1CXE4_DEIDV|nr:SWIM zinc finger family protein [Deinococcus deserti]ACO46861.2 putative SWIM zinc finger domain protein [Deinococcus deserti VCD115]